MLSGLQSCSKVSGGRGCCLTCSHAQRLVGAEGAVWSAVMYKGWWEQRVLSDPQSCIKVGGSKGAV